MKYNKIIFIGSKTTAYKCAEAIAKQVGKVHFYENVMQPDNIPACFINNHSIVWTICNKKEWKELLIKEQEKTLLISILNQFIIPKEILENPNLTIINMHCGFLPYYRGRNCGGWALYNEEEFTGTTWHYLVEKVDEGNILWQEKIPISENDTSLSVLRRQNLVGIQLLEKNIEQILNGDVEGIPQDQNCRIHFHYASEKPNNGFLNTDWSGKKISHFLRAMDYGPLKEFGDAQILNDNGSASQISTYKIEKLDTNNNTNNIFFESDKEMIIEKDGYKFTLTLNN